MGIRGECECSFFVCFIFSTNANPGWSEYSIIRMRNDFIRMIFLLANVVEHVSMACTPVCSQWIPPTNEFEWYSNQIANMFYTHQLLSTVSLKLTVWFLKSVDLYRDACGNLEDHKNVLWLVAAKILWAIPH